MAQAAIPGPLYISSNSSDRTRLYAGGNFPSSFFVPFPYRDDPNIKRTPPLVRVRLTVEYRVHSRQMLCVGGSAIPFGWSFLSIAKVPMSWQPGDIWVVDVELPAGSRVEYKYVVLEEQDWTRQVNESAEGRVEYTYRVAPESNPPDVQKITKQMAIVAWQAGANRAIQVPDEAELSGLKKGEIIERPIVSTTSTAQGGRSYGQQALGKALGFVGGSAEPSVDDDPGPAVNWERLSLDEEGRPFLERRDIWGKGESPSR